MGDGGKDGKEAYSKRWWASPTGPARWCSGKFAKFATESPPDVPGRTLDEQRDSLRLFSSNLFEIANSDCRAGAGVRLPGLKRARLTKVRSVRTLNLLRRKDSTLAVESPGKILRRQQAGVLAAPT